MRISRSILFLSLCLAIQAVGNPLEELEALIAQVVAKTEEIAADLANKPLTPDPAIMEAEVPEPPEHLQNAPPIFLDAWKEYSRFRASLPPWKHQQPTQPFVPAQGLPSSQFRGLLHKLIADEADPPPIDEVHRFGYTLRRKDVATLCHLRNGDVPGVLHGRLIIKRPAVYANLITHLGFDADLVRLGQWAANDTHLYFDRDLAKALCTHTNDRIAGALLDWNTTFHDRNLARLERNRNNLPEVDGEIRHSPNLSLLKLLTPDNTASTSTANHGPETWRSRPTCASNSGAGSTYGATSSSAPNTEETCSRPIRTSSSRGTTRSLKPTSGANHRVCSRRMAPIPGNRGCIIQSMFLRSMARKRRSASGPSQSP